MDFKVARENMVHSQVRTADVTDRRISNAMLDIRRERFVPASWSTLAYSDEDIPLTTSADYPHRRYLMEPMQLARLVQMAHFRPGEVVLEIGCGTGYSSALISRLCESVIALEEDEKLADTANRLLSEEGFDNVAVVSGPLNQGMPDQAPYDAIFINGLVEEIPQEIFYQLKEDGRLLAYVGSGETSSATIFVRNGDVFSRHRGFSAKVPPLPGFEKKPEFEF